MAMDYKNVQQRQLFEVKTSLGLKIICVKNIEYIEAARKYSVIHFSDGSSIIAYHLLKWYEELLLKPCFFRCHNSYIINCQFIDSYNHKEVLLKSKEKIPLSRNAVKFFKEHLEYSREDVPKFVNWLES